jgi:hypothetical protein
LVFLSRRVRPTPSGRLTRDVHQCNMCIWLAQGAYAGSYFDGSDWSAIRLVDRPGSQAIALFFAARIPTRRSTDMQTSACGREQASGLVTGRVDCARRRVFVGRQLKLFDRQFYGEPDEAYNSDSFHVCLHTRTWLGTGLGRRTSSNGKTKKRRPEGFSNANGPPTRLPSRRSQILRGRPPEPSRSTSLYASTHVAAFGCLQTGSKHVWN